MIRSTLIGTSKIDTRSHFAPKALARGNEQNVFPGINSLTSLVFFTGNFSTKKLIFKFSLYDQYLVYKHIFQFKIFILYFHSSNEK